MVDVPRGHWWALCEKTELGPKINLWCPLELKSVSFFGDELYWITFTMPVGYRFEHVWRDLCDMGFAPQDLGLQTAYPWFRQKYEGVIEWRGMGKAYQKFTELVAAVWRMQQRAGSLESFY